MLEIINPVTKFEKSHICEFLFLTWAIFGFFIFVCFLFRLGVGALFSLNLSVKGFCFKFPLKVLPLYICFLCLPFLSQC